MSRRSEKALFFSTLVFAAAFLSGCSTYTPYLSEVKGVPVKTLKPSVEDIAAAEKVRQVMEKEIAAMAAVTGNSSFTERRGIPEYLLGPGDVLKITFWEGAKNTEYIAEVRSDGKISYAFLDDIPVSGRTVGELHEALVEGLKNYIRSPRIEVVVKEYKSKPVLLFGQINKIPPGPSGPGKYPLKGKTSILDLIVSAGGPVMGRGGAITGTGQTQVVVGDEGGNADLRNVELLRKGKRFTLNLYDVMYKGAADQNVILESGDIVTVPELPVFGERVYVLGEVNIQGIYRLKDASDLLASLSLAGGPTGLAVKSDIKIIREYQERKGDPIILSASYDDITKRGDIAQNVQLKNGDIVWVPRILIGDINEFIRNTVPLLDYLLYPSKYRDAYGYPNQMRVQF
ncbi:MAG TPA: polysaccharide biosynthesis/export family protein [Syntrophales bacterium]|nr:polysaccharide biosynthesis/export family protein [Syntrophales bacterium]